jgi:hypothetical protein
MPPSEDAQDGGQSVQNELFRDLSDANSKLNTVCNGKGQLLIMLLSEGQMSDFEAAALMVGALPKALHRRNLRLLAQSSPEPSQLVSDQPNAGQSQPSCGR